MLAFTFHRAVTHYTLGSAPKRELVAYGQYPELAVVAVAQWATPSLSHPCNLGTAGFAVSRCCISGRPNRGMRLLVERVTDVRDHQCHADGGYQCAQYGVLFAKDGHQRDEHDYGEKVTH